MPVTKKKKPTKPTPSTNGPLPTPSIQEFSDVFTLAEAAAYLRLTEDEVARLVHSQGLPGRFVGTEWRFLKSAIQTWLSTPTPASKEGIWAAAGSWKDDPYVEEELKEIHKRRGRPVNAEGD